ncbi:hypothetical protein pdam_00005066 [Pocillopora damicornis]|uniref:Uncharacterized protein n=1 Tax=Pocillopora damicornis TaxID=46731 RepID=A0A3M6T6T4_POCDA|nr:hypothetical protein pdam_00005066 [Pocillopora damicornis]
MKGVSNGKTNMKKARNQLPRMGLLLHYTDIVLTSGGISIHVFVQTFIPSWAALMDATYPPGPDPITTRSTSPKQVSAFGIVWAFTIFERVNVELGLEYYAEKGDPSTFLKMPANASVNLGYLLVGLYWLWKIRKLEKKLKDQAFFYYLFSWMSVFYALVQFGRIVTQTLCNVQGTDHPTVDTDDKEAESCMDLTRSVDDEIETKLSLLQPQSRV